MMVNCQLQLGSGRGIEYRSQNPEFKKMELMPMLNNRVTLGHINESLAVGYLKKQGYKIIETNFKTKIGEIYIIAMDKKTLVFVEVKSRNPGRFGSPKNLVTYKKQKKISQVALLYLKITRQMSISARFDVVAITTKPDNPVIEIIKNAFELICC